MIPLLLGVFALALISSFILTIYVRGLALSRGWVSAPIPGRHLHVNALPRLGGIAIYFSFLFTISLALLLNRKFPGIASAPSLRTLLIILVPGTLIFVLGIWDDIRPIGPYVKFSVQALAGAMLYAGGLRILDLPVLLGSRHLGLFLGLPLTILWVIGITNAFNLIDGLDGLAAGSGLFSTLVVFVVAIFSGSPLVSLMTIALAGAILGFLRFNFNPATIFLGDCGSLFIGFMLSALALEGAQKAPTIIAVAIPVVSFGLPILETALSVVRRLISGRPVFTADREHIHHKLLQRGMSHRQVVIVLYGVSALFALLSLFLLWPAGSTLGLVLAVLGTGVWFGVQHLGYLEFGELRRVAQRTIEQRSIVINNLAIRRAAEELKVAKDYQQVRCVLEAAFSNNDFDAFDLQLRAEEPAAKRKLAALLGDFHRVRWAKSGAINAHERSGWNLDLELVSSANTLCGSLRLHRRYSERALLADINFLTSIFPVVLADALDRVVNAQELPALADSVLLMQERPFSIAADQNYSEFAS